MKYKRLDGQRRVIGHCNNAITSTVIYPVL